MHHHLLQHRYRTLQSNPLLGGRWVYLMPENKEYMQGLAERRSEIQRIQGEIKAKEGEFDRAKGNWQERTKIWTEIAALKEQIVRLERAGFAHTNLLQNKLGNNIERLQSQLDREMDLGRRFKIENNLAECQKGYYARIKPILFKEDFDEARDMIHIDDYILGSLDTGILDQRDVELLLTSDYLPFFDAEFREKLKTASQEMYRVERVDDRRTNFLNLIGEADKAWEVFVQGEKAQAVLLEDRRKDVRKRIQTLTEQRGATEEEQRAIQQGLERLERELEQIEAEIKGIEKQLTQRSEWVGRKIRENENTQRKKAIDFVSPETLIELKQIITEAKDLRLEKIHDYLKDRAKTAQRKFETVFKTDPNISQKTKTELEDKLNEAWFEVLDVSIEDVSVLKQLANNFDLLEGRMADFQERMREINAARPILRERVLNQQKRLKEALNYLPKDQLEVIKNEMRAKASKPSAIRDKDVASIDFILGEKNLRTDDGRDLTLDESLIEIDNKLEGFEKMSNEELEAVMYDLKTYTRLITDRVDADKAHKTIDSLGSATSLDELKDILKNTLRSDAIEPVSHKKFEEDYRQYTQSGYMVFYQRGDEWKIIVDEDAFDPSKHKPEEIQSHLETLKAQLRHELLHLEFEKNQEIKDKVRQELVEKSPSQWKRIRTLFIQHARSVKKAPPTVNTKELPEDYYQSAQFEEGWKDDDILSELFAMELGGQKTGNPLLDEISELIGGLNYLESQEIAKKYTPEEIHRGYEPAEVYPNEKGQIKLTGDLRKLAEDRFSENEIKISENEERLKELAGNSHLKNVPDGLDGLKAMQTFNNTHLRKLNDRLRNEPTNEDLKKAIANGISEISKDVNKITEELAQVSKNEPNMGMGILRDIWNNTQFLSISDFVKMAKDVKEYLERRLNRRNEDNAARLGMALFNGTALGSEFRSRQQKSEANEVSEWQGRYSNLDGWQLEGELKSVSLSISPNKDQLKAILRSLADKGRIRWTSPDLWKVLNKLQNKTEFKLGDEALLRNNILLREKLQIAFGDIYDNDEFSTLERNNLSNYDSNKSKYNPVHDRMQNQLTGRLDELLSQFRAGKSVDPMLYESTLENCMTVGRSYGENVMFHLIAGMAYGLLEPDRGLALSAKLNNGWPPVEWFGTLKNPTQKDFEKICRDNFYKSFEAGSIDKDGGADFKSWFWTTVQMNPNVIGRAKKSVSERGWDHDWGRTIVCLGDAETAQRFFQGRGGQKETKTTAVGNTIAGLVQMLEENSINRKHATRAEFSRIAGIMAMTEGILNGTAYNKPNDDNYTRETYEINNEAPRESNIGRHVGKTTKQHREINVAFLKMLDKRLFGEILIGEAIKSTDKEKKGRQAAEYIAQRYPGLATEMRDIRDIDQIYGRIGMIVTEILNNMSEEKFQGILDQIEAEAVGKISVEEMSANDGNYSSMRMAA